VEPFEEFFRRATAAAARPGGHPPYGYQARLAADGLPAVLRAPTGCGKTSVMLAWLWRRLHGPDPAATPRRLIYALPQHSLVEQVATQASSWLSRLGLADEVALHVVMGDESSSRRQWRPDMHRPAIVVGTVDSLVSKALNRGYGIGRSIYPIDFALVTNGAHWVIDETALCPQSTTTLRQLAAFGAALGTAEPSGLTCMTAAVTAARPRTADHPAPASPGILAIEPAERRGELAARLGASRTVRRLAAEPGDYLAIAAAAVQRHRPGTLTLVVLNTVAAARQVHAALPDGPARRTLLHPQFRGHERQALVHAVTASPAPAGHIVVATQVAEAGLDLNAALLVTEAAPWPGLVQRAGRCNRTGRIDGAELIWIPPAEHQPYPERDIAATVAELSALDRAAVTGEDLLARRVATTDPLVTVLRRPDLIGLFDTAADPGGTDLDIAPYVRDTGDLDVHLAWAGWAASAPDGSPPPDARTPPARWRCRVPLRGVSALLERDIPVWRPDRAAGGWARVTGQQPARPGEVLLVAAPDGGYDPVSGFDPAAPGPVPDSPVLDSPVLDSPVLDSPVLDSPVLDSPVLDSPVLGSAVVDSRGLAAEAAVDSGGGQVPGADPAGVARPDWISLQQHSDETRDQAAALLAALAPDLPAQTRSAVVVAAYLHDAGKAHRIWQDALCALAAPERQAEIDAGRPWAKSGSNGRLRFAGDVAFRHELASLLLIDGPLRDLLADAGDQDLARYLVLAHHGILRVQVRDYGEAGPGTLLGLEQDAICSVPSLFGQSAADFPVDLRQFEPGQAESGQAEPGQLEPGGGRSWARDALALRDRYGPFVLAYLETVVRMADWRASAQAEMAR
jgi:CRISPR-associated endonuclease/helicase Cas3